MHKYLKNTAASPRNQLCTHTSPVEHFILHRDETSTHETAMEIKAFGMFHLQFK